MKHPTGLRSFAAVPIAIPLALCVFACAPPSSEPSEDDPLSGTAPVSAAEEPKALEGITAAHNAVREAVEPAPKVPLPPLVWDEDVAAVAQAYAERCVYGHSQGDYGENLFAQAGKEATADEVVKAWADESSLYDYGTGSCAGKCGHYTQIVWRDSTRVGCGVANCTTGSPFGPEFPNWQYWVCNYDPPGNWKGEKPY